MWQPDRPGTPTKQNKERQSNTISSTDWGRAVTAIYQDKEKQIALGIRVQAPSTDIGMHTRIPIGKSERATGNTLVLTIQGHGNILYSKGGNIDLSVSLGQNFRPNRTKNWWSFSYSLGIQTTCSFSPYIDHPLFGATPTVSVNAAKAIRDTIFLKLSCATNSLYHYTSQFTLMLGADIACRISNQLLIGLSSLTRFSDTPTETGFITMHETSLYLTWMEVLP